MKITICGSMSFSKEMVEIEKELLAKGHSVVLPKNAKEYANERLAKETSSESTENKIKNDLIRDYFNEIADSDAVLILNLDKNNVEGYIGGNSFLEMGFAHVLNKKLFLFNDVPDMFHNDEVRSMKPIILNGDLEKIK